MLGATDESMTDRVVQTYWEGLLALGGLGLFGELLYNSASQLDNGAYGSVRQASLVGGPSGQHILRRCQRRSGLQVMQPLATKTAATPSNAQCIGLSLAAIPVLGGVSCI